MYGTTTCSNSSSSPPDHDDISLFLHQILHRSSSSTSPSPPLFPQKGKQMQSFTASLLLPPENLRISGAESSSRLNLPSGMVFSSSAGDYFPVNAANLSSSSVGTIDNDPDEYDCESEARKLNLCNCSPVNLSIYLFGWRVMFLDVAVLCVGGT